MIFIHDVYALKYIDCSRRLCMLSVIPHIVRLEQISLLISTSMAHIQFMIEIVQAPTIIPYLEISNILNITVNNVESGWPRKLLAR
jgi:hypothetical protein